MFLFHYYLQFTVLRGTRRNTESSQAKGIDLGQMLFKGMHDGVRIEIAN